MTPEEPLRVRVARAIEWTSLHVRGGKPTGGVCPCDCGLACGDIMLPGDRWAGRAPGNVLLGHDGVHNDVPPYGEDSPEGWACTGPLLTKYGIGIQPSQYNETTTLSGTSGPGQAFWPDGGWDSTHECWEWVLLGAHTLEAAALLIIALAEAGRLKP